MTHYFDETPEYLYVRLKKSFVEKNIQTGESHTIQFGIQFTVTENNISSNLRIFHNKKKGSHIDTSPIKQENFKIHIEEIINQTLISQKNLFKPPIENKNNIIINEPLIGTDESGKGDYFGPLVIAGIYIKPEQWEILIKLGVQDSKKLSDYQCNAISKELKVFPQSIVTIGPEKYNDLYDKIKNLNKLLAWGHARVIENLLEKIDCNNVLSDQFGDESLIQNALMKRGKSIKLIQRHHAEENIVVASASILARVQFLNCMDKLSREYNIEIPKGASKIVIDRGKQLVRKHGQEILKKVAKLHFKTTSSVLS